jgi:hypothetical protein
MKKQNSSANKSRSRTSMQMRGEGTDTHVEAQRQYRNFGSERTSGNHDHRHPMNRRDTNKNTK